MTRFETVADDGRFQLLMELADGPYARTFLARDNRRATDVLGKVPHARIRDDERFESCFHDALEQALRVRHPHIVHVLGAARTHHGLTLFVEFLEGRTLAEQLEGGELDDSIPAIYRWLFDVGEALDYIHAKGAIHGEVRPHNIIFADDGKARLSDFVLGSIVNRLGPPDSSEHAHEDGAGYLAPELVAGGRPTERSDQYALAALVFTALVGRSPEGDSREHLRRALARRVSAHAANDVLRALAPRPEQRYRSCYELAKAFGLERARQVSPQSDRVGLPRAEVVGIEATPVALPVETAVDQEGLAARASDTPARVAGIERLTASVSLPERVAENVLARLMDFPPGDFVAVARDFCDTFGQWPETIVSGGGNQVEMLGKTSVLGSLRIPLRVRFVRSATELGADEVRGMQRATRSEAGGILVSLSGFLAEAREAAFVPGSERIALMEGFELARLIVERWSALSRETRLLLSREAGASS